MSNNAPFPGTPRALSWGLVDDSQDASNQGPYNPDLTSHAAEACSVIFSDTDQTTFRRAETHVPGRLLAGGDSAASTACLSSSLSRSRSQSLSRCYSRSRSLSRMTRFGSASSTSSTMMDVSAERGSTAQMYQGEVAGMRAAQSPGMHTILPVSPRPYSHLAARMGNIEPLHLVASEAAGGAADGMQASSRAVSPGVSYSRIGSDRRGARVLPSIEEEMLLE